MSEAKRPGRQLVSLSHALDCHNEQDPIGCLVRRLRLRLRRFNSYEDLVTAAAKEAVGPPPEVGLYARMGHSSNIKNLVDVVRRRFVRTGSLPKRPWFKMATRSERKSFSKEPRRQNNVIQVGLLVTFEDASF